MPVEPRPIVVLPPRETSPPPVMPVEVLMVREELVKALLGTGLLYSPPLAVLKTGRFWFREEMVVEPLEPTVRYWALEEEATVKMGRVGLVELPSTAKLAVGVEELTPIS